MEQTNNLYENLLKDTVFQENKIPPIKTGIKAIDQKFIGLVPGELIFLGAWNPIWNTQFLINLSLNLSKENRVNFYSFQDDKFMFANRISSVLTNKKFDQNNDYDTAQLKLLNKVSEELKLNVNCNNLNKFNDIYFDSIRDILDKELKFIVIDNFEYIFSKKAKSLNIVCEKLAKFAKRESVCIIISHLLPIKSFINTKKDIRPDISIFKLLKINPTLFDKIFFLHRDEYFGIEDVNHSSHHPCIDFIVGRNRNGDDWSHLRLAQDKNFNILNDVVLD